jgi:hypothetical protein
VPTQLERGLPHLLLRADADPAQGAGHVMRCLALAESWHGNGGQVTLLSSRINPALRKRTETLGIDLAEIPMPHADTCDLRGSFNALEKASRDSTELPCCPRWLSFRHSLSEPAPFSSMPVDGDRRYGASASLRRGHHFEPRIGRPAANLQTVPRTQDVCAFWNGWAELGQLAGTRDVIAKQLEVDAISTYVRDGMRILEVGCGNGITAIELARRYKAEILGIDFSAEMIAAAGSMLAGQNLRGSAKFHVRNVLGLSMRLQWKRRPGCDSPSIG